MADLLLTKNCMMYKIVSVENVIEISRPERDKIVNSGLNLALKVCTALLLICGFLSTFTVGDYYIFNRFGVFYTSFILSQWVKKMAYVLFPMAVFKKNRACADVAKYVLPIFIVISALTYGNFFTITMVTETASPATLIYASINEFMPEWLIRSLFYLENALMLVLCVGLFVRDGYPVRGRSFIVAPLAFVGVMPLNIFENFYDKADFTTDSFFWFDSFTVWHLLAIVILVGMAVIMYFALRNRSKEQKWDALCAIAMVMFIQYNSRNSMVMGDGYNVYHTVFTVLPLYICNIGIYVALLSVLTRNRVLLSMSFFVHAAGALSMFVYFGKPEMSNYGIFCSYTVLYLVFTHAMLFSVCIMPSVLGLYKFRPKDSIIPMLYYLIVIIVATVASGYITSYSMTLSYEGYYLSESELIVPNYSFTQINPFPIDWLPVIPMTIGTYEFNLLYLIILLFVYIAIFWAFALLSHIFTLIHRRYVRRHGRFIPPDEIENESNWDETEVSQTDPDVLKRRDTRP